MQMTKANGTTITRMTSQEFMGKCPDPIQKLINNAKKEGVKTIFKYGMTKEEYDSYLDKLYG